MVSAEFDPISFWEYWSVSDVLPITLAVGITECTVCGKLTTTGTCWQLWLGNQKYVFEYMTRSQQLQNAEGVFGPIFKVAPEC